MEALMGSWSRWRMQALRGQNGIMQTVSLRSDQKHECTFRRFRWLPVSVRSSPQIISCQAQTSDTVLGPQAKLFHFQVFHFEKFKLQKCWKNSTIKHLLPRCINFAVCFLSFLSLSLCLSLTQTYSFKKLLKLNCTHVFPTKDILLYNNTIIALKEFNIVKRILSNI